MKSSRLTAVVALLLAVAQPVLALLSWLLSATMTGSVRSMLSAEGIRWLFAHTVEGMLSPVLIWILLGAMGWGCLHSSRLLTDAKGYRRSMGLRVATLLLILYVGGVLLLTALPHAVLLSATGSLWPSPFSRALVPVVCVGLMLCAVGYGTTARTMTSLTKVVDALVSGLKCGAPLLLLYVLAAQLWSALRYVFLL